MAQNCTIKSHKQTGPVNPSSKRIDDPHTRHLEMFDIAGHQGVMEMDEHFRQLFGMYQQAIDGLADVA